MQYISLRKLSFEEFTLAIKGKSIKFFEKSDKFLFMGNGSKQKSSIDATGNSNPSNGVEEKMKENIENETNEELFKGTWMKISKGCDVKIWHKLGVLVVENYAYFVGELSSTDDLCSDK